MDQYTFIKTINNGSFGLVMEVFHNFSKVRYYIKQVYVWKDELLMKLKHPIIFKVYNYFKEDDLLCIVMEFIEGVTI
jgi:serine/threonine protein kinase